MKKLLFLFSLFLCTFSQALPDEDFLLKVQRGAVNGASVVSKFGRNAAVGTTMVPVCDGGVYQTPAPSNAVTLAIISTDADDTVAGAGARQVTLVYLNSSGVLSTDILDTNGLTESTDTVTDVWRLLRAYVSSTGTYGTQSVATQQGTLTIRVAGAGATWATIPLADTGFGAGQSLIGGYTVPAGYTAFLFDRRATVDSTKAADIFFFMRENANDETVPYSPIRVQAEFTAISGVSDLNGVTWTKFNEFTDLGFMAKTASGTANVTVHFDFILVKNTSLP